MLVITELVLDLFEDLLAMRIRHFAAPDIDRKLVLVEGVPVELEESLKDLGLVHLRVGSADLFDICLELDFGLPLVAEVLALLLVCK